MGPLRPPRIAWPLALQGRCTSGQGTPLASRPWSCPEREGGHRSMVAQQAHAPAIPDWSSKHMHLCMDMLAPSLG